MLDHYAEWGIDRAKLFHVTNGQRDYAAADGTARPPTNDTRETYNRFGFFGQIVDAKGVHIVLRAVDLLRAEGFTDFAIEINGDNINYASPEVRAEIERFMEEEKQRPSSERRVWFNGSYETRELRARMSRVDWCIVPSLWREAFALVISEAWMFGKPVICSNCGSDGRPGDERGRRSPFRDGRPGGARPHDQARGNRARPVAPTRGRLAEPAVARRNGRRLPANLSANERTCSLAWRGRIVNGRWRRGP